MMTELRDMTTGRDEPLFRPAIEDAEQPGTVLVVSEPQSIQEAGPLADLRQHMMYLDSARMRTALAEYKDRRTTFREWLRSQLVEGIHYGYPPTCQPKFDSDGNQVVSTRQKDGSYKQMVVPLKQWTAKPSLYKAGADFICDLLGVREEYHADLASWEQMGKPKDTFVMGCYLYSRSSGQLLGEGRGVRQVGQKGGDANNAIKMAKKSAKVDSVLDTWGLADLFTQDQEDAGPERHDNPDQTPDAPKTGTRAERSKPGKEPAVTKEDMGSLNAEWLSQRHSDVATPDKWAAWMEACIGRPYTRKLSDLTQADIAKCWDALGVPRPEET